MDIKILIVDDELKIIEVVKSYLNKEGYKVYEAMDGKKALQIFDEVNPALVILDLMLPDLSGEELCKTIRKKSRVPIIMLTAKVEEDNVIQGFNLGADDYVTKPFSPRQLIARVKALLRRSEDDIMTLSDISSYNDNELIIDNFRHEVRKNDNLVNLTNTEYKILITMAKYPKKAFTREELVLLTMGDDYDGFDRVIDTHVKNLRQKLEEDTKCPKYIKTVHGVGYKFGGE
ncbi:response regulator transcription factor [Desnuesiella massiliensis]|uniref:response regulator transcription factor n=1 Tax=Desnuesiella massiliensis TaxID=1650662 RepID=UPI0006E38ACB|nr:response regulator transcription factor [Desnuesiella massiliensis]